MSKVSKLADIQKTIQQNLINPFGSSFPNGLIKSSKRLSAQDHLAIYQRSYTSRLRECMSKQFSVLEYALGKDLFQAFADEYLRIHPSTNYNLVELGKNFPLYLEKSRPDKDAEVEEDWPTFMIELAKFEYSINVIFDEESDGNYQLADIDTNEEQLNLIPVFYLFDFQFPIQKYYSAFSKELNPELPLPESSYLAITRHEYKLSIHNLNRGQFLFLKYLKKDGNLELAKNSFLLMHGVSREQFEELWPIWKNAWLKSGFFKIIQN